MRILLISPFLPYPGVPHAGGKLVNHLLSTLARSHSVFLVARCFPGDGEHVERLRDRVAGVETVRAEGPVRSGSAFSVLRTVQSYVRLARKADEVLRREKFDLCQVEYTETGVFWTPPPDLPSVMTCHDVIAKPAFRRFAASRGIARGYSWLEWKIKFLVERRAVSKFRRVLTLSEVDREWAQRLYPEVPVRVLRYPGGLDFGPVSARNEVPGRILFVGALNRPQNIEAVRYFAGKVWPSIRNHVPSAEFRVVGGGASDDFRRELSRDPGIRVTGRVERLAEQYASAAVFVAPVLLGGGIIVKILDAMAAGVPVVTTSFGNEGIRAAEGADVVVSNRPEEFADGVLRLLGDSAYRKSVGEAGKRFVETHFSQEAFEETLRSVYGEAAP